MKRIIIITIFIITLVTAPSMVLAQGMMGTQSAVSSNGHTASEEAEGKAIWERFQAKQVECKNLTNDNFEVLGEYFMGQMAGSSHEVMNNMMVRMIGDEGEKQMHIAMGKRNSGCDTSAVFPQNGVGFMSMMGSGWGNLMGGWGGFGALGWVSMLLFWALLILGVIALIRYLGNLPRSNDKERSPLDILKERYAKGEIDKKEFEQMKKDLA